MDDSEHDGETCGHFVEIRLGCLHQTLDRGDWDLSIPADVIRVLDVVERLVNYVATGEKSVSNVRKLKDYAN